MTTKCSCWVIMWKWYDGSGGGVVKVFNTFKGAEEIRVLLETYGDREFYVVETEFRYE